MSKQKIKRELYKNYYPVPNDIFDIGLNPSEIVLYALFIKFDKMNHGFCCTDFLTIKGHISLSDKTIKKYISSLENKRIIKIESTKDGMKVSFNKRDMNKNYFLLPNEVFFMELSSGEIAVYAFLLKCEDKKTYQCYPSYRTIGNNIGASINSVKKYVEALERKNLISTESTSIMRRDFLKLNGNLLYTINPIVDAYNDFWDKKSAAIKRATLIKKHFPNHKK
ncbi:MAG: helix-turn-helix domain-containing protein [Ruminococcus sp.]|nr:helix-turn-helix domain-containing protein [Ruminococcus sp.]